MKKKLQILNKHFIILSLLVEKNKSSICFQSLRKEDLYRKGKKGISLKYIFFIGGLIFENFNKIRIHNTINYYNLNLSLNFNKKSINIVMLKSIKYQNNKTRW